MIDQNRNIFICPHCKFTILTDSYSRLCAKCETPMEFYGREKEKLKELNMKYIKK